jgi:hypothetical protein
MVRHDYTVRESRVHTQYGRPDHTSRQAQAHERAYLRMGNLGLLFTASPFKQTGPARFFRLQKP